jgi:hypothetical protein
MIHRFLRLRTAIVEIAEKAVACSVVGIQLGRAQQQRQCLVEAELLGEQPALDRNHLGLIRVELHGAIDQRFDFEFHVLEWRVIERQPVEHRFREAGEGRDVLRVGVHGTLEIFDGLEIVFSRAPVLACAAQQVEFQRFHFFRLALRPSLRSLR